MAVLRLFAAAREAAGTGRDVVDGATVGEVLDVAVARYGADFAAILGRCKVWRNGDEAARDEPVGDDDEVAVLPPVSGGATGVWCAATDAYTSIRAHQTAGDATRGDWCAATDVYASIRAHQTAGGGAGAG